MRLHKIERGRYILWFGENFGDNSVKFEFSNKYNFGLGLNVKREEKELQLSVYCWRLFNIWLTFEFPRLFKKYYGDPLESGVTWISKEHVLKVELLSQKGMDSSKPAVIYAYWDYRDWLFGRSIYSESQHSASYHLKHTTIALPEGEYKLALDFYTGYWHRRRSPFVRSIDRVEVIPEKPVPIPGKGENSWDQDEDATHASTEAVRGRSIEQIAEDFKQHILEQRERHGGKNWLPETSKKTANA